MRRMVLWFWWVVVALGCGGAGSWPVLDGGPSEAREAEDVAPEPVLSARCAQPARCQVEAGVLWGTACRGAAGDPCEVGGEHGWCVP